MIYEDMSDFEINKLVGSIFGLSVDTQKQETYVCMSAQFDVSDAAIFFDDDDWHDYCNNPSDAWRIITSNDINLSKHKADDYWFAFTRADDLGVSEFKCKDNNPLRAACICFLKLKDVENNK